MLAPPLPRVTHDAVVTMFPLESVQHLTRLLALDLISHIINFNSGVKYEKNCEGLRQPTGLQTLQTRTDDHHRSLWGFIGEMNVIVFVVF